jgi:AraC-type DNA-binding domain-containing proteins
MFGSTIYDFVQTERLKKAKIMLENGKHSVQSIALELGFSNTSNFTNSFKKLCGYSPSEWQKIHHHKKILSEV